MVGKEVEERKRKEGCSDLSRARKLTFKRRIRRRETSALERGKDRGMVKKSVGSWDKEEIENLREEVAHREAK